MICILINRGILDTDMHTGRMPSKHKGKDQGNASVNQGAPKIVSKPQEARRMAWNRFYHTSFGKNQPCWHMDVTLPGSRIVRQ